MVEDLFQTGLVVFTLSGHLALIHQGLYMCKSGYPDDPLSDLCALISILFYIYIYLFPGKGFVNQGHPLPSEVCPKNTSMVSGLPFYGTRQHGREKPILTARFKAHQFDILDQPER